MNKADTMVPVHPLILSRESRRIIDPHRSVEPEKLMSLFEAARWAPSCSNNQPWRFILTSGDRLSDLKQALSRGNRWAEKAPAVITLTSRPELDCRIRGRDYFLLGLGLALENLLIQAVHLGLVAHPIAGFDENRVREVLQIPDGYLVHTLVVTGYPGDASHADPAVLEKDNRPRSRLSLESLVHREIWNPSVSEHAFQ